MSLRLTLRTLLSYLDDTLEPAQAKAIGQKVAESDQARELIERIRTVTRRRRLTTPPATGPGGIEPNTIAEYLDNEVTPEQAAEVEQICLASDVHLAEVAACHQILTLVLGEPAPVPAPARQRMYGLVKGPEAIPFRKPPRTSSEADLDLSSTDVGHEGDETLRLGLPALTGGGWRNPLLLGGGAVAAACLLALAFWQIFSGGPNLINEPKGNGGLVAVNDPTKENKEPGPEEKKGEPSEEKKGAADEKKGEPSEDKKQPEKKGVAEPTKPGAEPTEVPFAPPDPRLEQMGRFVPAFAQHPAVLLEMGPAEKPGWKRLADGAAVTSNRTLLSLPMVQSGVETKTGVALTLWGTAPELWPNPFVFESVVRLHPHDLLDLDLTLDRGRIALKNTKDRTSVVRVRFENPALQKQEFIDFTLKGPEAEVLIERMAFFPRTEPFYDNPKAPNRVGPTVQLACIAAAGTVGFKTNELSFTMNTEAQGGMLMLWSTDKGINGPLPFKRPEWAAPTPPLPKGADAKARAGLLKARDALVASLPKKAVEVAVSEMTESDDPFARRLAVRCLGALDDLPSLIDALERENNPDLRLGAIETLRYWVAQARDHDPKLHEFLRTKYKNIVARKIMELLHSVSEAQARDPVTFEVLIDDLDNPVLPLRELSYFHLSTLVPAGRGIPYATAGDRQARLRMQAQWRQLIPRGQLPSAAAPKKAG